MFQFYSVGVIALLSAMSPGPDFIILTKNALCENRQKALFCAFGIALGILVHTSYCVLGLAIIINQSLLLFNVIKIAGAFYLMYLGYKGLRAKKTVDIHLEPKVSSKTSFDAFKEGFCINLLNPKCSLFMLSVFTFVISPHTSHWLQAAYGLEISMVALAWFCFLAISISFAPIRNRFSRFQYLISRITGGVLVGLGASILLEKR